MEDKNRKERKKDNRIKELMEDTNRRMKGWIKRIKEFMEKKENVKEKKGNSRKKILKNISNI